MRLLLGFMKYPNQQAGIECCASKIVCRGRNKGI